MRTLMPSASICCAMVFIFAAEPSAFWMSQVRLYFVQSALSATGSELTQRGDDVVSGRMMPTLAPLPSIAPELGVELFPPAGVVVLFGVVVVLVLFPLELHPARAIAAATPSTATETVVLRMRS